MGRINGWRVVVGGLAGGTLLWLVQGITHGAVLKDFWEDTAKAGFALTADQAKSANGVMLFMAWITGVLVAWLYAAVRPRLGAGLMTAVVVAVVVWGIEFAEGNMPMALFTPKLAPAAVVGALGNFVGFLLAASVGGWVYREVDSPKRPVGGRR